MSRPGWDCWWLWLEEGSEDARVITTAVKDQVLARVKDDLKVVDIPPQFFRVRKDYLMEKAGLAGERG